MNKNNNQCNNCSKIGHLFHQCKLPIISYGVILFKSSSDGLRYLMIRRKDSFGYIDFIRGKYACHNLHQIQKSIDEMSLHEKNKLVTLPFDQLLKDLWGDNNIFKGDDVASSKKFELIKNGLVIDNQVITLQDIINQSTTEWSETEWEFPKGRRFFQEKDMDCALREFEEETGCSSKNIEIIENIIPFEELFIGSNHKSYKHKYFLAYMKDSVEYSLENYQKSEVSKLEWKTIDECLESIRPYNLEKKQLIININKVLQEYRLYS